MTKAELSKIIWEALKEQACVHPDTAARIVTLNKVDVDNAIKETPALLNLCDTPNQQE